MDVRLKQLLDGIWEHDLPLGPFGDFSARKRAEEQWEAALTTDDCLALLDWVERPTLSPHWEPGRVRWLLGLADRAAWHIGRAGRRICDPSIAQRLVSLLSLPGCRSAALTGLIELADPTAFDAVLALLDSTSDRLDVCVALAALATPEQIDQLRALADSAPTLELRVAAADVVAEYETITKERHGGPSDVSDLPAS